MNYETIIAVCVTGALVFFINWAKSSKIRESPAWMKLEGAAITAVRLAEKAIPDGTEGAGLKRLDNALKYFLVEYERMTGNATSVEDEVQIKGYLATIHSYLQNANALKDAARSIYRVKENTDGEDQIAKN